MLLNLAEKETSFETKVGMALMPSAVAFITYMSAGAAALVTYLLTNTRKGELVE